jgi:hypothetical protein
MRIHDLKMTVLQQRELDKARRIVQRAFGVRRASYHYEYLD